MESAQRGAGRVIGIDTWEKAFGKANEKARKAGVRSICEFTGTDHASHERLHRQLADVIFSLAPGLQIRWRDALSPSGRWAEPDDHSPVQKADFASDFTTEKPQPATAGHGLRPSGRSRDHFSVLPDSAPGNQLVRHRDDCEHQQNMNQTTKSGSGDQAQGPKYDKNYGDCKQHDVHSLGQLTESGVH